MIDARMQKLIAALSGRAGVGGVGGHGVRGGVGGGLGSYGASASPWGAGGMFQSGVAFNPFGAQTSLGFQGLVGPSQGDAGPAAQQSVAAPSGDSGTEGQPGTDTGGGSPTPGFYGSAGDAQPSSPWMPSTGTPNASVSGIPGQDQQDVLGRILRAGRQL